MTRTEGGIPNIVDRSTYQAAVDALLAREKAHTQEGDAIAAARRRIPMVEVDAAARLIGERGKVTLLESFEGRRMLIAYYFMWHMGKPAPEQCEGCTWVTTQITELSYLHSRDITFAVFCQGPYEESARYRDFMGWITPWYSAQESLAALLAGRRVGTMYLVCYLRQGDKAFETYWTTRRGVEAMDYSYALMDLTVYGRQEKWEDSPAGWPQQCTYTRTRTGSPTWEPEWPGGRPISQWPRLEAGRSDNLGTESPKERENEIKKVKGNKTVTHHQTGTREEWLAARLDLLKAEKELTHRSDELARQRQELPWVRIAKDYRFETDGGKASLADLFQGRSQLVVYHFMFGPGYNAGCPACSATADSFNGVLPHLEARDVTMICISRAPLEKLLAYRLRMGWNFNWVSSHDNDFNFDFGVSASEQPPKNAPLLEANELAAYRKLTDQQFRASLPPVVAQNASTSGTDIAGYLSEGHGFSVFVRDAENIYHTYSTYTRGTEFLMGFYAILDRTPEGRDEDKRGPMTWLRLHDEYGKGASKDCCS